MKKALKKQFSKMEDALSGVRAELEEIFSDLSEAFAEKSERWQDSEAGEQAQSELDEIEELVGIAEDLEGRIGALAQED